MKDEELDYSAPQEGDGELKEKIVSELLGGGEKLTIALVQRRYRVGFSRACRVLDALEKDGVIEKRYYYVPTTAENGEK